MPEPGRIEPVKAGGDVDVAVAKNLLEKAKQALINGRYRKAKKLAAQSRELAQAARAYHRKVINELHSLEDFIEYITSLKFDTIKAQKVLDEAKKAALQLDYPGALRLIEDAKKVLHRSTFVPFPLLNKNVTIKTIIGVDKDKIIYKVRIENKSQKPLGEIVLLPAMDENMFAPVSEQMMGELLSMQAKEVTFVLTPMTKNWSLGVPGHLIIGRDINLKTILECNKGTAIYKVMIHNNKGNPIHDLKVGPFVPRGLTPDEEFKVIEVLPSNDSEVVIFDLTPYHFEEEFQPRVSRYVSAYEEEFPVEWGYQPDEEEEEGIAEKVAVTGYLCPECDGPVTEDDDLCPHCGVRFLSDENEEEDEDEEEEEEEEEDMEIDEELLELETTGFSAMKDKFKSMMFMPDIIQVVEPLPVEDEPTEDEQNEEEEETWSADDGENEDKLQEMKKVEDEEEWSDGSEDDADEEKPEEGSEELWSQED